MTTIPDLWPSEALKVDVRTPAAILRAQAAQVRPNTKGILVADVTTTKSDSGSVIMALEILAPSLDNYRHRLLDVQYNQDEIYPAIITAKGLKDTQRGASVERKTAYSEGDFIDILMEVLNARETIALLQSLIARSNELGDEEQSPGEGENESV